MQHAALVRGRSWERNHLRRQEVSGPTCQLLSLELAWVPASGIPLSPGSLLSTVCLKTLFEKEWKPSPNSPATGNIGGENIWGGLP